jgi:hypothetical protein
VNRCDQTWVGLYWCADTLGGRARAARVYAGGGERGAAGGKRRAAVSVILPQSAARRPPPPAPRV